MKIKHFKLLLVILLMLFSMNMVNAELVLDETGERFSIPGTASGFKGGTGTKTLGKHIACAGIPKIGTPYEMGGHRLDAFDCTGFTHYALTQVGLFWESPNNPGASLGNGVVQSYAAMKKANLLLEDCNYVQPGDLLYLDHYRMYATDNPPHVGIFLGGDNFIHQTESTYANAVQFDILSKHYSLPGQIVGCARPYTYNQELAYEMKYQNFSKESQAIDGYNFSFSVSGLRKQTNYIRWNDWKCEEIVGRGGKIPFEVINSIQTSTGSSSDSEVIKLIKIDDETNLHLKPLEMDKTFPCDGLLGNVGNKSDPAYWIQMALNVIRIAAVSALLLLSTIDLIKILSSQDDTVTKKTITRSLKRFMYTIILFFLPILLNLLFGYMKVYGNEFNPECGEIR